MDSGGSLSGQKSSLGGSSESPSISDATTIQTAFVVPIVCYAYVLYFALRGHRPAVVA